MSAKDPWRFYNEQHNRDVDQALARKRKQKLARPPENPGDPNNPWSKAGWSITAQMRLTQEDPARAKQMCLAAGKVWVAPYGV